MPSRYLFFKSGSGKGILLHFYLSFHVDTDDIPAFGAFYFFFVFFAVIFFYLIFITVKNPALTYFKITEYFCLTL